MNLAALATTFGLIFLAELPDKTAYTVLLLSARSRPLPVLLGAWCAFLAQGFVALALGSLLARLPPGAVRWAAAAVFLGFGLVLLFGREEAAAEEAPASHRKAFGAAFALVFLAEMGDATQVGTAALVARLHAQWSVFVGATLALWSVSTLMVLLGRTVGLRIPKLLLRRIAGALFIAFAVISVLVAR